MTASDQAKAMGLKSLAQVSQMSGVSRQTLENWSNPPREGSTSDKRQLFRIVLLGVVAELELANTSSSKLTVCY